MSRTFMCRSVSFTASHYYRDAAKSDAENREIFGEFVEPHQHDWRLSLWIKGPINRYGMIMDLTELDRIIQEVVVGPFDGKLINEVDPDFFATHQPTTETLAGYFGRRIQAQLTYQRVMRCKLAETEDLFAEWQP